MSHTYQYNAANQRIKATLENGMYWEYGYDALGQVTSGIKRFADTTPIPGYNFGYSFDDIGNRTQTNINGQESSYSPNLLNQYDDRAIPSVFQVQGETNNLPGSRIYLWNHDKTLKQQGEVNQGMFYAELPADNTATPLKESVTVQALVKGLGDGGGDVNGEETGELFLKQTPEQFAYDDDGNLLVDGKWTYTWNAENRLVSMETIQAAIDAGASKEKLDFAYDSQGRRFSKAYSSYDGSNWIQEYQKRFIYDNWNLIAEIDESHNIGKSYSWGFDLSDSFQGAGGVGGLLQVETSFNTSYPTYDGNGNVIALVDSSDGSSAANYEYSPFGEVLNATGVYAADNHIRFSTKYTDIESDYVYYGVRYYSPERGQWLNRDKLGEIGGINIYGLLGNNAINKTDYLGFIDCSCLIDMNLIPPGMSREKYLEGFKQGYNRAMSLSRGEYNAQLTYGAVPEDLSLKSKYKRYTLTAEDIKTIVDFALQVRGLNEDSTFSDIISILNEVDGASSALKNILPKYKSIMASDTPTSRDKFVVPLGFKFFETGNVDNFAVMTSADFGNVSIQDYLEIASEIKNYKDLPYAALDLFTRAEGKIHFDRIEEMKRFPLTRSEFLEVQSIDDNRLRRERAKELGRNNLPLIHGFDYGFNLRRKNGVQELCD